MHINRQTLVLSSPTPRGYKDTIHWLAATDAALIDSYAVDDFLSGGIIRDFIRCWDWKTHINVDPQIVDLIPRS